MVTVPRRDCACYGEGWSPTDILAGIQCLYDALPLPEHVGDSAEGGDRESKAPSTTPVIVDRIGALMGIRWMTGPDYLFSIDYYGDGVVRAEHQ